MNDDRRRPCGGQPVQGGPHRERAGRAETGRVVVGRRRAIPRGGGRPAATTRRRRGRSAPARRRGRPRRGPRRSRSRTRSRRRARPRARRAGRRPAGARRAHDVGLPAGPVADELDLEGEVDPGLGPGPRRGRARPRRRTSAAVPFWSLTMKLACFSETTAPPIRRPLRPASSMRRPADSPSGLRKTLPADRQPERLVGLPPVTDLVEPGLDDVGVGRGEPEGGVDHDVTRGPGLVVGRSHGGVLEPAVPVAQPELVDGHDRLRPVRGEDARRLEDPGHLGVVGPGVGPHGAADRAGDGQAELEAGQAGALRLRGCPRHLDPGLGGVAIVDDP